MWSMHRSTNLEAAVTGLDDARAVAVNSEATAASISCRVFVAQQSAVAQGSVLRKSRCPLSVGCATPSNVRRSSGYGPVHHHV